MTRLFESNSSSWLTRAIGATALCLVASLGAEAAAAQGPVPIGNVEGAEFRPYPIAVPKFRADSGQEVVAAGLTSIIRNDLDLSGAFNVLDDKAFIDTDGITLPTVKFADWLNVAADGLVKAQVRAKGAGFEVEVHAYEVATARERFSKTFRGDKKTLRSVAHRISDAIYESFTGEPGVFSTQIAVVRKVAGAKHIFTMDMDGDNVRQLTTGGSLNLLPSWAPDGQSVLFTSYRMNNPDLFEKPLRKKAKRISARPGLNTGGSISPNGKTIALTLSKDGNSEIYLLNRQGSAPKRLTNQWGIDTSPSWSPDGKKIAFVSSRRGNPHIFTMNADGSNQKRVTFQGTYNQTPAYSPRGTHIAFTARDEFNRFDIFLIDMREGKSGEIIRLTQDQGNNEEPTFSPNGRLIAFVSNRTGSSQVWVMNLDGTKQRQITFGGTHKSPAWGPFVKAK